MMYWNGHMTTAGWVLAIVWTVIVAVLVFSAIYWLVSLAARREGLGGSAGGESARAILDRRLARGEISVEEYEKLWDVLDRGAVTERQGPPPTGAGAAIAPG